MNEMIFARMLASGCGVRYNVIVRRESRARFSVTPFDRETAMTAYRDRVVLADRRRVTNDFLATIRSLADRDAGDEALCGYIDDAGDAADVVAVDVDQSSIIDI